MTQVLGGQYEEIYKPGVYEIKIQTFSTQMVQKSSKQMDSYKVGELVRVVNVVKFKQESRIRGQLDDTTWISLKAMDTQKRFVTPCNPGTVEIVDLNTISRQVSGVQIYVTDDRWVERTTWIYDQHTEETFGPLGHARYNYWNVPKGQQISSINVSTKNHKGVDKCRGIEFVTNAGESSGWFGCDDGGISTFDCPAETSIVGLELIMSPICPVIKGVVTAQYLVELRMKEKMASITVTTNDEGPICCSKGHMVTVLCLPINQEKYRCCACEKLPELFSMVKACPDCDEFFCNNHKFKE